MGIVWIRGQGGVLVRADAITMLASTHGSLNAECAGGRTVRLADSDCPGALQLALLDEIRRAGADDRHAMVITPPAGRDSATWRREYADTLLELLAAHDGELPGVRESRLRAVQRAAEHLRRPAHGEATGEDATRTRPAPVIA
jgi:hypothetical protein